MSEGVLTDKKQFLNELADLVDNYKAEIFVTPDDPRIQIKLNGEIVFAGYIENIIRGGATTKASLDLRLAID